MTISCYDKVQENSKIVGFICLLYLDRISYKNIFSYLKENYEFKPTLVHIHFQKALRKALIEDNIFIKKPMLFSFFL